MSSSLKDYSRTEWGVAVGHDITNEQIQIGCLQRIADATELMAKRHQELMDERDKFKRWWKEEQTRRENRDGSIRSLRGQITKLKNQLAERDRKGE